MDILNGVLTGPGTWTRTRTMTMQGRQDCYFYQITPVLEADRGLVGGRQVLPPDQKDHKDKTRLFCQETNRRRRMMEERCRQWSMKEKRWGENILQKRREQIQHATERFQRANHQPPPRAQRRKPTIPAFGGKVVNLNDASLPQPFFLSKETIRASGLVPIKPATVSESHHRPTPSAVESDTDVLQVQKQNKTEPEPDHSPQFQDIHQLNSHESESLFSRDSLECEDDVCDTNKDQRVFSSLLSYSEEASSDLYSQNQPTLDLAPDAGLTLVGGEVSKKPTKHKNQVKTERRLVSTPSWQFTPLEAIGDQESQKALHNYKLCEENAEPFVMHARSPQVLSSKLEALLDVKQKTILGDRLAIYQLAEEGPSPDKNSDKMLFRAPHISLNNSLTNNVVKEETDQRTAQEKQQYLNPSINILKKISNLQLQAEKPMNSEWLQSASTLKSHSDAAAGPEEELQDTPISEGRSDISSGVRFPQGILKKNQSEKMSGHLGFIKPATIRDRVDLTQATLKETESSKAVRSCQMTDVGVQVSLVLEETDEVMVQKEHATRAGAGPVSSTARKGTLVQPQSAAELTRIARSKGKSMIPRPPPRMKSVKGRMACNSKAPCGAAQARYVAPADRSHATYAPLPSAFIPTFSEGNSKTHPTLLHQDAPSRARETRSNTPTDEEITQLWQELCRSLTLKKGRTPKNGHKPGSGFRNHPCTQPWPPRNRLHRTPQPINLNARRVQPSKTFGSDFQNKGNGRAAQSHLAHVEALHSTESDLETQRRPLIDLSFQEQEVLRALQRLTNQLKCVWKRGFVPTPSCV